jgi:hypothetical protein
MWKKDEVIVLPLAQTALKYIPRILASHAEKSSLNTIFEQPESKEVCNQ